MDYLQELGMVALGSRLRRLGDSLAAEAAGIYETYGVDIQPKWFPVFYLLSQNDALPITTMAKSIGCSHPVVSQTVKEMVKAGIAQTAISPEDARVNVVKLTDAGRAMIPNMEAQVIDVGNAVAALLGDTQHNIWKAMDELEYLLSEKGLVDRVKDSRKARESTDVEIIEYIDEHHADLRRLNLEWIEKHFEPEPEDFAVIDDPHGKVLTPGGAILMARLNGEMVGTVGLLKMSDTKAEMIKMAVTESAKGKSIGYLLGKAALAKAKAMGFQQVFLESNTTLVPAINLYRKLGFERVTGSVSPYSRCNIQMQKDI